MAHIVHKLTPERVRTKSKRPSLYADGGGLYLRVTRPAACSWVYRYMIDGKAREMGAHFAVLREADLIESQKQGTTITYRLKLSVLEDALLAFAETVGVGLPAAPRLHKETGKVR